MDKYYEKYLKYKRKYLLLKEQIGGKCYVNPLRKGMKDTFILIEKIPNVTEDDLKTFLSANKIKNFISINKSNNNFTINFNTNREAYDEWGKIKSLQKDIDLFASNSRTAPAPAPAPTPAPPISLSTIIESQESENDELVQAQAIANTQAQHYLLRVPAVLQILDRPSLITPYIPIIWDKTRTTPDMSLFTQDNLISYFITILDLKTKMTEYYKPDGDDLYKTLHKPLNGDRPIFKNITNYSLFLIVILIKNVGYISRIKGFLGGPNLIEIIYPTYRIQLKVALNGPEISEELTFIRDLTNNGVFIKCTLHGNAAAGLASTIAGSDGYNGIRINEQKNLTIFLDRDATGNIEMERGKNKGYTEIELSEIDTFINEIRSILRYYDTIMKYLIIKFIKH